MAKKKKNVINEFGRAGIGLGSAAFTVGLTAGVVEKAGGSAAPIQTVGSFLPVAGVAIGGGLALGSLRGLQEQNKKLKRRQI